MTPSICTFYPKCKRGNSCRFLHVNNRNSDLIQQAFTSSRTNQHHDSLSHRLHELSFSESLENIPPSSSTADCQCLICYEEADQYGLLSECNHIFCLKCVKEWRGQKDVGDIKRTCPACRKESLFYIHVPKIAIIKLIQDSRISSNQSISTKKSLIDAHLQHRKSIKCKFINKDPPASNKCPFGDQCHFSHLDQDGKEILVRNPVRRSYARHHHDFLRTFLANSTDSDIDDSHFSLYLFYHSLLNYDYNDFSGEEDMYEYLQHELDGDLHYEYDEDQYSDSDAEHSVGEYSDSEYDEDQYSDSDAEYSVGEYSNDDYT